jgi:hypothetical protein
MTRPTLVFFGVAALSVAAYAVLIAVLEASAHTPF